MKTKLKEGDVIRLDKGHKVYAKVPKHFVYSNHKGDFDLTESDVVIEGEFEYLAGEYVVYKTSQGGEGTGHVPHDTFPGGYRVYCERLKDGIKVNFYQNWGFSARITDIEPIGKARLKWVFNSL